MQRQSKRKSEEFTTATPALPGSSTGAAIWTNSSGRQKPDQHLLPTQREKTIDLMRRRRCSEGARADSLGVLEDSVPSGLKTIRSCCFSDESFFDSLRYDTGIPYWDKRSGPNLIDESFISFLPQAAGEDAHLERRRRGSRGRMRGALRE